MMWEMAFSQKPRRRVSTKVTVGAMPPDLPPKCPRQAWWKDISWWPGGGLVGNRRAGGQKATSSDEWACAVSRQGSGHQVGSPTSRNREGSLVSNWACRGRKKRSQIKKVEPEGTHYLH
mmetsp:Transcript_109514/g.171261  ORF Transcript_109514/g.171261 Transcript_109514/m.171261 type:complete len:119 (+) Transcript_109514:102-458(+)